MTSKSVKKCPLSGKVFPILILLTYMDLVLSAKVCESPSNGEKLELPVASIFPSDSPTENLTYEVTPSEPWTFDNKVDHHVSKKFAKCEVHIQFFCSASYPIEWIEIYNEHTEELIGTKEVIQKNIWADRVVMANEMNLTRPFGSSQLVPISINSSLTKYNISFGLSYSSTNYSKCVAVNYSCRSVENSCLQSNIIGEVDLSRETIQYKRSKQIIYFDNRAKNQCNDVTIKLAVRADGRPAWKCESLSKHQYLSPGHSTCDSAMHCNSFFLHHRNQKCVTHLNSNDLCLGCGYMNVTRGLLPGFIWCKDSHGKVITALHYFFSVPQRSHTSNLTFPKLYLDWTEANPSDMMLFEPLEQDVLHVGENVTFSCSVSRYYFAYGHRFAFEFKNGTTYYTDAIDGEHDLIYNTNRMSVTIHLDDTDLIRVYCLAPVWNTTEWVNKSLTIVIRDDATEPLIELKSTDDLPYLDGKGGEVEVMMPLHGVNQTIKCIAHGVPVPKVQWIPEGNQHGNFGVDVFGEGEGVQSLIFRYVTNLNRDLRYRCEAKNFLGRSVAAIRIRVKDQMTIFIRLSAFFVFSLTIIFGIMLSLCWSKVHQQRKQLRALTEDEIREFKEGNSELIQNSTYLDNEQSLLALPYNDQYEIPMRKLSIDTSNVLGSGNFGQVFKGLVQTDTHGKMLEVAVKTGKTKVDISYFKAFLSEVKIMAYIGKHANVVCLVGACTENIRKREIYIAVEYCAKGSLEQFLKKSRVSFVNLISNDTIYIDATFCNEDDAQKYENIRNEKATSASPLLCVEDDLTSISVSTSTVHLLKWSREIANGMEFLGSKKIIHGDLATRNVLLTQELVAKIGDFGLSRQLMDYSNYVRAASNDYELPWKWMAYEVLQEGKFSPQADIWSFGVTLWEIFSLGQHPYPGITWNPNFTVHLQDGLRLHKPPYATSHLYNLMLDCWAMEPYDRPTFSELKDIFEGLLMYSSRTDYFKPDSSKYRKKNHYMNRSTNLHIYNPGYSLLGMEPPTAQQNLILDQKRGRVKFENISHKKVPPKTMEDVNGYLKPAMISSSEDT